MSNDAVALYHAEPASNSLKVLQAMHEKGVAFDSHYVDLLRFEQHSPEFLEINPAGQVPVLVHAGRTITESTLINEYVDAVFDGPPLRPADPYLKAQMRIWTKFVDEVFRPSLSFLAWHRVIPNLVENLAEDEFEARVRRIPLREKREKWLLAASGGFTDRELQSWRGNLSEAVDRLEAGLKDGDWLVANSFSLADIAMFAMSVGIARSYPDMMNETRTPRSIAWLQRMRERPGVAAALAMPNHANLEKLARP